MWSAALESPASSVFLQLVFGFHVSQASDYIGVYHPLLAQVVAEHNVKLVSSPIPIKAHSHHFVLGPIQPVQPDGLDEDAVGQFISSEGRTAAAALWFGHSPILAGNAGTAHLISA